MKAIVGIFLYSYPLNATSKNVLSFLLCLCIFFNKIRAEWDLPETKWGEGRGQQGGETTQTMYAHVNK
jgi:hypothetical protein